MEKSMEGYKVWSLAFKKNKQTQKKSSINTKIYKCPQDKQDQY